MKCQQTHTYTVKVWNKDVNNNISDRAQSSLPYILAIRTLNFLLSAVKCSMFAANQLKTKETFIGVVARSTHVELISALTVNYRLNTFRHRSCFAFVCWVCWCPLALRSTVFSATTMKLQFASIALHMLANCIRHGWRNKFARKIRGREVSKMVLKIPVVYFWGILQRRTNTVLCWILPDKGLLFELKWKRNNCSNILLWLLWTDGKLWFRCVQRKCFATELYRYCLDAIDFMFKNCVSTKKG